MDLTFLVQDEGVFNVRTAAVVSDGRRMLLHRRADDGYWALVGGRVNLLESSDAAIRREISEELGETVAAVRLLWMVENFFSFEGQPIHEICTVYLAELAPDSALAGHAGPFGGLEGDRLVYRWFAPDELNGLDIRPAFLKTGLNALPETPCHLICRDPQG